MSATDQAAEFLELWFADAPATDWLVLSARKPDGSGLLQAWFPNTSQGHTEAAEAAEQANCTACVWFGVGTRREKLSNKKRGGAKDVATVPGLWLDLDVADPNAHKDTERLAPDKATALQVLGQIGAEPSVTVWSGHGLQCYWRFDKPQSAEDLAELLDAWQQAWKHIDAATGYTVDTGALDLARIMRLPGTINRKPGCEPTACEVVDKTGHTYTVDELSAAAARCMPVPAEHDPPPTKTLSTRPSSTMLSTGNERPGDRFNADHTIGEVLVRNGWTFHHHSAGATHYTRPGKERTDGESGTWYEDIDRFHVFSDAAHPLEAGETYDAFGLAVRLEHGGDLSAAARALRPTPARPTHTERPAGVEGRTAVERQPPNLPAEFWETHQRLAAVRTAAQSRLVSPDALLASLVARLVAATSPVIRLPAITGSQASLNLIVAAVGSSGTGKGASVGLARELAPVSGLIDVDGLEIGSGEGLSECFMGMADEDTEDGTKRTRKQVHKTALLLADEGQTVGEIGSRKGSTLMPAMRTAWSGAQLGQTNASADRRRHLDPHSYRLCLVLGLQPEYAVQILSDAAGGTPQRFWWASAQDLGAPDEQPEWPGELEWTPPRIVHPATVLEVPTAVRNEITERRRAALRGDPSLGALDGHRDLARLKVAAGLALLIDPTDLSIGSGLWKLAGTVLDTSDGVRRWLLDHAAREAADRVDTAHRRAAGRKTAELEAAADFTDSKLRSAAESVARKVIGSSDPLKHRQAKDAAPPASRGVKPSEAVKEAERLGWIQKVPEPPARWAAGPQAKEVQ